jgi:hypothetical protein
MTKLVQDPVTSVWSLEDGDIVPDSVTIAGEIGSRIIGQLQYPARVLPSIVVQ